MKKHKDTKEIESTMMRISKAQRDMELSKQDRRFLSRCKNLLKGGSKKALSTSQQKPSEAWYRYCMGRHNKGICHSKVVAGLCYKCKDEWVDKHCELRSVK